MVTKRYCMACDLKNDPKLIEEYINYHAEGNIWPEVTESIREAGVEDMQIFLIGDRLFMIMEVNDSYSHERKAEMDASNPKVQQWEELMSTFQQNLPFPGSDAKWINMERIFKL